MKEVGCGGKWGGAKSQISGKSHQESLFGYGTLLVRSRVVIFTPRLDIDNENETKRNNDSQAPRKWASATASFQEQMDAWKRSARKDAVEEKTETSVAKEINDPDKPKAE